jgi:hypothetical protein
MKMVRRKWSVYGPGFNIIFMYNIVYTACSHGGGQIIVKVESRAINIRKASVSILRRFASVPPKDTA